MAADRLPGLPDQNLTAPLLVPASLTSGGSDDDDVEAGTPLRDSFYEDDKNTSSDVEQKLPKRLRFHRNGLMFEFSPLGKARTVLTYLM